MRMTGFASLPLRSRVAAAVFFLATVTASSAALQAQSAPAGVARPGSASEFRLTGRPWKLISLNGHDLDAKIARVPQMSLIEEGSRVIGYGGCNRFLGTYSLQQARLVLNSDVVVTRRVCPDQGDVETRFLKVLQSVDSWEIVDGGVLQLSGQKQVLARFK